ncbi:hypothetical protein L218DRAFT_991196 [Marasmius fiardii PR-910]|nr:hypothetical protein L218DRAFT_991196 [Marasmius fiardii PR-910]
MSSEEPQVKSNVNTQETSAPVSIDADIARISSILSPEHNIDPEEELSEKNLAELFEQLQKAEGMMDGVENKLDDVMGQLDGLLEVLGKKRDSAEEGNTDKNSKA